jgi:hypothetical protein
MRRSVPIQSAAAALWLVAAVAPGAVGAQPAGPAAVAVLYDQPNYHGRSVRVVGAMSDLRRWGFARRAMSGHFEGDWTVCDAPRYGGRCVTVTGTQADLLPLGLDRQIASLHQGEIVADAPPSAAAAPTAPPAQTDDGYFDRPQRPERAEALPSPEPAAESAPQPTRAWASAGSPDQGVAGYASVFFARPREAGADAPGQTRAAADAFCRDQGLGPTLSFDTDGHILRDVLCRRD